MELVQQSAFDMLLCNIVNPDEVYHLQGKVRDHFAQQIRDLEKMTQLNLHNYCFCQSDVQKDKLSKAQSDSTLSNNEEDANKSERVEELPDFEFSAKPPVPRRRRNPLPDIRQKLRVILQQISCTPGYIKKPKGKGTRGLHAGRSTRRSKYIGVSVNHNHFQTLVNIGGSKKYIATYTTEKEAALAYDFYSLGLHGLRSRTNLEHTGEELTQMIQTYLQTGVFTPSDFIN